MLEFLTALEMQKANLKKSPEIKISFANMLQVYNLCRLTPAIITSSDVISVDTTDEKARSVVVL
jgi:hypothetical protein